MGCDGGSIPKRDELVKQKQRKAKVDQNILNRVHWFSCALSKKPLSSPVVSCGLGKLYNRDAILEFLLDRTAYGDGDLICKHIKSLKDVVTLQLELNPSFSEAQSASLTNHDQEPVSRYICPITMKEMSGKYRFVYLDTCGCVMSEQAMKEVPSKTCIKVHLFHVLSLSVEIANFDLVMLLTHFLYCYVLNSAPSHMKPRM